MSAVALERQFWWKSNLQDLKSFQRPTAFPKPFPSPQLTQTSLLPNKIIYCTSNSSPHFHVFNTLPDHKQSNFYLRASSPVCDTRITQKIQERVYCKVNVVDASVVPPSRMHAQAISCSLAVSMIEDIAAPKKSSLESLYLITDQSPYTSASSPFTTISCPSSLVTSPTSQCSEFSASAPATGANHCTDSLSPSQKNNTWSSKISSKCNSNSLTSKSKAVYCGRRRLIDEEGYIRRAACICVNKEETQVLLVTSKKDPCAWLVPGGGLEVGEEAVAAAHREAWEEAGIQGVVERFLGLFESCHHSGSKKHRTAVFVFVVTKELKDFPEARLGRRRRWFSLEDALLLLARHRPLQSAYLQLLMMSKLKMAASS